MLFPSLLSIIIYWIVREIRYDVNGILSRVAKPKFIIIKVIDKHREGGIYVI